VLAGWVTASAVSKYLQGESGGFKIGVDLAGGTILVYEIDTRKQQEQGRDKKYDPIENTKLLAESLKRRIDPNDLYNITIRPAGGEARVEIILPTGGVYRTQKAEKAWADLIKKMEDKYEVKDLDVGRGKILELAERIHLTRGEKIWAEELFGTPAAWNDFLNRFWTRVGDQWPELEFSKDGKLMLEPVHLKTALPDAVSAASTVGQLATGDVLSGPPVWAIGSASRTRKTRIDKAPVGNFKEFITLVQRELGGGSSEKVIENWIKDQAWEQLLIRVKQKWPNLKGLLLSPEKERKSAAQRTFAVPIILPDSTEQLVGFIQANGSLIGEAGLASVENILGNDVLKSEKGFTDAKTIEKFVEKYYGPSLPAVTKEIQETQAQFAGYKTYAEYKASGRGKDLTLEEVQRIKDLVAKVGSLEFRILANNVDDKEAEKDAIQFFEKAATDPALQQELKDAQEKGLPPPGPRRPGSKDQKIYDVNLRGQKSRITYSWVELGPQVRKDMGLGNAAEFDPKVNETWREAQSKRGRATTLKDRSSTTGRQMSQGALFYSRKCEDRNLPEEERRDKAVEYFVLTRDPELDPKAPQGADLPQDVIEAWRTPKIDGGKLRSARPDTGSDLRPVVSFTFNETGGNLFGDLTRKNIPASGGAEESQLKRHLAIVLDGQIMSAPTINSEIRTAGQISGNFTKKEVDKLVNILRAGALPASLKPQPVAESTMGATLGQDTIAAGVTALIYSFLTVLGFMIIYYRFAGLVASVALLANLLLTVGFMVAVNATFTLPGLAGLVLMVGMAVDANVLIYERLREERERGAGLALAIRNGYDRAFPTIIDTHLSSIFTAIVLYIVGNDQLKGFGVSLTAGLIISLFTSLFMTRTIFDFWLSKNWLRKLSMMRLFSRPDIDFMGIRYIFFTVTIVLSVLGITVFIGRLPNDLNIDFRAGTAFTGKLTEATDLGTFRGLLSEERQKELLEPDPAGGAAKIKVKEVADSDGRQFDIQYQLSPNTWTEPRTIELANKIEAATPADREKIFAERAQKLPDYSVEQLFPNFDLSTTSVKSRYFTVRTSEIEKELVQATLDRLLRSPNNEALLDQIYMYVDSLTPTGTHIRFYTQKLPANYNSAQAEQNKTVAELIAEKEKAGVDFDTIRKATGLDRDTLESIKQGHLAPKTPAEQKKIADALGVQPDKINWYPGAFASPSILKNLFTRELLKVYDKKKKEELPFQFELSGEGKSQEGSYKVLRLKFSEPLREGDGKAKEAGKDDLSKVRAALAATQRQFEIPQPVRLETFDVQLAAETQFRAMWAILASWLAIALYLWFRFGNWTFGVAAVICLIHDLFFTMGVVAACYYVHTTFIGQFLGLEDFKIDLPAVAALLTLVGYSVNDTIVVFDRIREVRGKNPDLTPQMINDSVNQTLSRTLLTSLATWLVVIVLFIWGGPGVKLFAFVMVVGVIVGTYSSIYIASPLLLMLGEGTKSTGRGPRQQQPQSQAIQA
jgi:SecD/SecF fusion protein